MAMGLVDAGQEAVISATVEAALKPVLRAADALVLPTAEYVGQELKEWLADRIRRLKSESLRMIEQSGRAVGHVIPKIGVRIVEGYALEDDEWLRQSWAGLMASAAVESQSVLPAFPEILRNLTRGCPGLR